MDQATIHYSTETFGGEQQTFYFPIGEFASKLAPTEDKLEIIFRQCNHVDNTEWIAGQKLRSMSVGDTVVLDGKLWKCSPVGWEILQTL